MGLALTVWLIAAFIVGAMGVLARVMVPPPVIVFGLTGALLLAYWRSPGARTWVQTKGPRVLVAFHLVRIPAGVNFLVLYRQGVLPDEFATVAGWGDISVGIAALLTLAFAIPVNTTGRRYALLAWNTFGLADILLVVGNATRLFLADPSFATPFTTLPVSLLPTFVVPIVIASHIVLYTWYARAGAGPSN